MIKNRRRRITTDSRDSITTGIKTAEGLPKSLDYFNIEAFPELQRMYGEKPTRLLILMPSNDIADCFDDNFHVWGSNGQYKRQCNGDEEAEDACFHRLAEDVNKEHFEPGELSRCLCQYLPDTIVEKGKEKRNPLKCQYDMRLSAFVADPETGKIDNPTCYRFTNHSRNSGDAIYSELDKVRTQLTNGVLIGIPFWLSVRMVPGKLRPQSKFPIWSLEIAVKSLSEFRAGRLLESGALPAEDVTNSEERPKLAEPREGTRTRSEAPNNGPHQFPEDHDRLWDDIDERARKEQAGAVSAEDVPKNRKPPLQTPAPPGGPAPTVTDKRHLAFIRWFENLVDRDGEEACYALLREKGYARPQDVTDPDARGDIMSFIGKELAKRKN